MSIRGARPRRRAASLEPRLRHPSGDYIATILPAATEAISEAWMMKVAAYQCPLLPSGSMDAIDLIRQQIKVCESEGVVILCCPEAVLGGLADNAPMPAEFAIDTAGDRLAVALAPLASRTVTTIVGFTELAADGWLYNSAAVLRDGRVVGRYRKHHPAINRSIYRAGDQVPVFEGGGLKFGVIICNDSNFVEPARTMVSKGATALFVPTNNGLTANRAGAKLVAAARVADIARAMENNVSVIRADVSGSADDLISVGCSGIVDADGTVIRSAPRLTETLLVADIDPAQRRRRW